MSEGQLSVFLGLSGWIFLFATLYTLNREDRKRDLEWEMREARSDGRPPPGEVGDPKDICKRYRATGPTPCEWPRCECTKGMAP